MYPQKVEAVRPDSPRIAVIEDEQDIREAFRFALELEGYEVMAFKNGHEALEALKGGEKPSLILLDLMMPIMSGFEFLEAKAQPELGLAEVPVLIISAFVDQLPRTCGVRGHIRKPVDLEDLFEAVAEQCRPLLNRRAA